MSSGRTPSSGRVLLALFTLSGACGLTFEVLWARQLATVVGGTSKAITTVVALFMAGLALGSLTGGKVAARVPRPVMVYGAAELSVGLSGLLVSHLLPRLEALSTLPARYILAGLCLLVPSALMGTTFPLIVEGHDRHRPHRAGTLYALNTAGAALGCLLAGFVGIGLLGVRRTATIAAALNLLCGLVAIVWVRLPAAAPVPAAPRVQGDRPAPAWIVVLVPFTCGAAALGAQILWTRALIPYLNSSTYAFAAILAVFLLALAAGSIASSRSFRNASVSTSASWLLALQLALALLVAITPQLMGAAEAASSAYVGVRRVMTIEAWLGTVVQVFLRTAAVIALPTALMGASFPLCLKLAASSGQRPGTGAGLVSAANTLGGIVGCVAAGFFLIPRVGVMTAITITSIASLAAASFLVFARLVGGDRPFLPLGLVAAAVVAVFGLRPAHRVPFVGRLAEGHRTVLLDEGPQDTTAVVDIGDGSDRSRLIFSNGISYTGDTAASRRYMRLLGHLPALLADDPTHALVICIGTGMTAGAVARHPGVRTLDLVDISPVVTRTLPHFAHVNDRIWADPRVVIHEADGRQFMGHSGRTYGVITLEPPPPRAAGAASLYTLEMYERARASLRPAGIIAQWLPLHGLSDAELELLTRTFLRAFPNAAVFVMTPDEAALIGSPSPFAFDVEALERRLAVLAVQDSLRDIGFPATSGPARAPVTLAAQLLALGVAHGPKLAAMVGDGPIVTDDEPLVETFAAVLASAATKEQEDEDGRRPFLRRLLTAAGDPLPTREAAPPEFAEARAHVLAQVAAWAR